MEPLSLLTKIVNSIENNPTGISSSEVCNLLSEYPRGSVTSAIAKLKKKNRIFSVIWGVQKLPLLFSKEAYLHLMHEDAPERVVQAPAVRGSIPQGKLEEAIREVKTSPKEIPPPEEIARILKPFADYAEQMKKNGLMTGGVWISATTKKPTVQIGEIKWFLEAQNLYKSLL